MDFNDYQIRFSPDIPKEPGTYYALIKLQIYHHFGVCHIWPTSDALLFEDHLPDVNHKAVLAWGPTIND